MVAICAVEESCMCVEIWILLGSEMRGLAGFGSGYGSSVGISMFVGFAGFVSISMRISLRYPCVLADHTQFCFMSLVLYSP